MTNQRTFKAIAFLFVASVGAACATDEAQPTAPRERTVDGRRTAHMEHGRQLFAELDADKSGSLTAAELDRVHGPATMIKVHFAEIDANRDGALTQDELDAAMERHHADIDSHHEKVVEQFDTDGDGELDATEREAAHRYMFDQADSDDSGSLTAAELQSVPGPGAMMATHFADLDANGDGALSYEEITTAMESHHRHHP